MGCGSSTPSQPVAQNSVTRNQASPPNLLMQNAAAVSKKDKLVLSESEAKAVKERKYTNEQALWAALEAGGTVLLKGSWLVDFAKKGQKLPRRQDLPAKAVWDVKELKRRGTTLGDEGNDKIHIMALSYCWMEKTHPDPDAQQMKTVAKVIEMRLNLPKKLKALQCYDVAIFIDYACLPQHPRSPEDQNIFDRGLKDVNLWYAHDRVTVLLLTCFPKSRVDNTNAYANRGWPSFEKAVASLIKVSDHIIDLQFLEAENDNLSQEAKSSGVRKGPCSDWLDITWKCRAGRTAPLTPEVFNKELDTKTFTNGADAEFVKKKYAQTLKEVLGSAEQLQFMMAFSGPDAAISVAQCLPYCSSLKGLWYDGCRPGAQGMAAFAAALEDPEVCPKLETAIFAPSGADKALKMRFKTIFDARKIDSNNGQV